MPTPVLSPWNSGSGFGAKDKEPLAGSRPCGTPLTPAGPLPGSDPVFAEGVVAKARARGWITDDGPRRRQEARGPGVP